MNRYWNNQIKVDVVVAVFFTAGLWIGPRIGLPTIFSIDGQSALLIARSWVAPLLTLLGMMSATTSFIFSVIDRSEFSGLKGKASEGQLWRVFSENLLWLGASALSAVYMTFLEPANSVIVIYGGTFLIVIVSVSVVKFVWAMRQIISVRIAQSELKAK